MTQTPGRRQAAIRRAGAAALIGAILTVIAASLPVSTVLQGWMSDAVVAARAKLFGVGELDSRHVLVVGMDNRTLTAPELAKVPQAMFTPYYAALAEKAFSHGARGLVMDLILAYDAKDLTLDGSEPLRRYDDAFLRILKAERSSGRVVLGRSGRLLPARRFRLIAGSLGLGIVEVPVGLGGAVRQVPTSKADEAGKHYPTLTGRALALLGLEGPPLVELMPPGPVSTLPIVSMIDVLRCEDPAVLKRLFEGRVLFLGGVLPGQDRIKPPDTLIPRPPEQAPQIDPADASVACAFPRPPVRRAAEQTVPGVFLHAAATDAVASGWQVEVVGLRFLVAMVFAAAFLSTIFAFVMRPALGILSMSVVVGAVFLSAVIALQYGFYLKGAWAMAAAPVGFLVGYGVRIRLLDRASYRMRREFGRYLSPVLVQHMVDTGRLPRLDGEERDVTVLFADLSGFTAASERLESTELMRVLNRYLDAVAGVVADHGGYVDKFIGDAVMAIFNAPAEIEDHAAQAVAAAGDIVKLVGAMAEDDRSAGSYAFHVKVGIASGPAIVGNVGARDRVNYTVVGQTVNVAARLEALPGIFGTPIVIGPQAAKAVAGSYRLLRIATVHVKGISEGLPVYAPLDGSGAAFPEACVADYHAALEAFEAGDFSGAAAAWSELASRDWPGAPVAARMAREAARTAAAPPADWSGILEAAAT